MIAINLSGTPAQTGKATLPGAEGDLVTAAVEFAVTMGPDVAPIKDLPNTARPSLRAGPQVPILIPNQVSEEEVAQLSDPALLQPEPGLDVPLPEPLSGPAIEAETLPPDQIDRAATPPVDFPLHLDGALKARHHPDATALDFPVVQPSPAVPALPDAPRATPPLADPLDKPLSRSEVAPTKSATQNDPVSTGAEPLSLPISARPAWPIPTPAPRQSDVAPAQFLPTDLWRTEMPKPPKIAAAGPGLAPPPEAPRLPDASIEVPASLTNAPQPVGSVPLDSALGVAPALSAFATTTPETVTSLSGDATAAAFPPSSVVSSPRRSLSQASPGEYQNATAPGPEYSATRLTSGTPTPAQPDPAPDPAATNTGVALLRSAAPNLGSIHPAQNQGPDSNANQSPTDTFVSPPTGPWKARGVLQTGKSQPDLPATWRDTAAALPVPDVRQSPSSNVGATLTPHPTVPNDNSYQLSWHPAPRQPVPTAPWPHPDLRLKATPQSAPPNVAFSAWDSGLLTDRVPEGQAQVRASQGLVVKSDETAEPDAFGLRPVLPGNTDTRRPDVRTGPEPARQPDPGILPATPQPETPVARTATPDRTARGMLDSAGSGLTLGPPMARRPALARDVPTNRPDIATPFAPHGSKKAVTAELPLHPTSPLSDKVNSAGMLTQPQDVVNAPRGMDVTEPATGPKMIPKTVSAPVATPLSVRGAGLPAMPQTDLPSRQTPMMSAGITTANSDVRNEPTAALVEGVGHQMPVGLAGPEADRIADPLRVGDQPMPAARIGSAPDLVSDKPTTQVQAKPDVLRDPIAIVAVAAPPEYPLRPPFSVASVAESKPRLKFEMPGAAQLTQRTLSQETNGVPEPAFADPYLRGQEAAAGPVPSLAAAPLAFTRPLVATQAPEGLSRQPRRSVEVLRADPVERPAPPPPKDQTRPAQSVTQENPAGPIEDLPPLADPRNDAPTAQAVPLAQSAAQILRHDPVRNATEAATGLAAAEGHRMPRHLPAALAKAATKAEEEGRLELLLDPVELGRVRFEMSSTAGDRVQVNVVVERPETLDLLRRNVDSLRAEFRDAGFDASTLSFSEWGKGGEAAPDAPQPLTDLTSEPLDEPSPDQPPLNRNTSRHGLDLRL